MNSFSYDRIGPGHDRTDLSGPRQAEPGEWPKFEAALAVVNRDVTATLPGQDALILMVAPSWQPLPASGTDRGAVHVAMPDGRWQGNALNAVDLEEGELPEPDDAMAALTLVAEAAQETVMELRWQVWPVCREHKIGMHVRPAGTGDDWCGGEAVASDPVVWWCQGGRDGSGHDVCLVGELAATLPGKERRALRRGERGDERGAVRPARR
ncbi:hypothetical protein [Streptomyces sp. NPDC093990]|uniref:hypothetical protein n=1 Tax=Streptomyces sp. NPDC093990 TaxID=3155306 RepID=UPI00342AFCE3